MFLLLSLMPKSVKNSSFWEFWNKSSKNKLLWNSGVLFFSSSLHNGTVVFTTEHKPLVIKYVSFWLQPFCVFYIYHRRKYHILWNIVCYCWRNAKWNTGSCSLLWYMHAVQSGVVGRAERWITSVTSFGVSRMTTHTFPFTLGGNQGNDLSVNHWYFHKINACNLPLAHNRCDYYASQLGSQHYSGDPPVKHCVTLNIYGLISLLYQVMRVLYCWTEFIFM